MIDTCAWKEFHLYDIFDIDMGNKMDRGKMYDGPIAFVGRTANNNGINARVGKVVNHEKYGTIEPYKKGCITLALGGSIGSCFIQEEPFYTSQNVAVLIPKTDQSDYALRFITSVITHSVLYGKYEAFTEELNKHIKTDFVISLPTTSDGQPDWNYMESYMRAVMEESEKSLENLRKADDAKHLIDVSGWGEFRVGDLFDKLTLKCLKKDFNKAIDCSEEQTDEFSLPLTNAKHFNNGIQFYGRPEDWESAEMTIDIVSNGAIATGDVYAQPQRTGVLWDSYLVKCKYDITSELVLQYMSCVIQRCIKQYFGWDDKCTWDKVKEQMIRLPITSTGEPDWQYMEDYMRRIMDKSKQIIADLQIGA